MDEKLPIGILHLNIQHGAVEKNRENLIYYVKETAQKGAKIIVAPELAISGYSFGSIDEILPFAEEVTGETVTALATIAKQFGVYICFGFAEKEKETGMLYNSAVVLDPEGQVVAHHRKHVPAERRWCSPGMPSTKSLFESPWGKVGVLICADSYYGLLPRSLALQGADILLICANWPPTGLDPRELWRARAIENGVGIIAVNRTGVDRAMDCQEAPSYAVTPNGTVLLDATSKTSKVYLVEYPLEEGHFPSRLRKKIMSTRTPEDYNAISLDMCGVEDLSGLWKLPPPGTIKIQCFVPSGSGFPPGFKKKLFDNTDEIPRLAIVPYLEKDCSLEEFLKYSEKTPTAIVTKIHSSLALISRGKIDYIPPERPSKMFDFLKARIGVVKSEALYHPEKAVSLSKQGCDIIVSQTEALDDKTRLILGIKCLERAVVAVSSCNSATICVPPQGHERWHETTLKEPGICEVAVDTNFTRKKRFLERVDFRVLLKR